MSEAAPTPAPVVPPVVPTSVPAVIVPEIAAPVEISRFKISKGDIIIAAVILTVFVGAFIYIRNQKPVQPRMKQRMRNMGQNPGNPGNG